MGRVQRLIALCVAGVLALMAIFFFQPGGDDALGRLRKTGVVRIGYAVEAPFAVLGDIGEITGEAPEIARHVVERLGISHIEWHQVELGGLIPELRAGRIDVIAAGLFITPERAEKVLFSRPTMAVRQAMLVPAGNPRGLRSYMEMAGRWDIAVAVLAGSIEDTLMARLGVAGGRLLRVPDALTGRRAVETGLADALLLSEPSLRWMLSRGEPARLEVAVDDELESGLPAFAFRLDEPKFRDVWDEALAAYLGSEEHLAMLASFGLSWTPPATQKTGG
ncbi:ectoine/hydroxyectoine ABC transporter substrate-binding protein EhuB [Desulfomicrobium escambiense]|uniref:ectoine/hydroxyectoine ABC transporter substrate-binding protein EhuB n=1 Tax=Desulfomicrobium escambiense TaxID=29503 RepID=UPI000684E2BE|nr:ectoine/hydroxyectoine ABC transporter substrate-binding protein EhuB [Desulfomicrobium escambiense]